jgi:hypothetical protein
MSTSGRLPCLARIHAEPEVKTWYGSRSLVDNNCSCYTKDTDELEVLRPLKSLRSSFFDFYASNSLEVDTSPREPGEGVLPKSVNGGDYPFSIDLTAAVGVVSLTTQRPA